MRSSNPMLKNDSFQTSYDSETMSLGGVIWKSFLLLLMLAATAFYSYSQMAIGAMHTTTLWISLFVAVALSFATSFFPRIARFTALFYAAFEGIVLGAISAMYEIKFHGIVLQAVLITLCVFLVLLFLYATRIVKATENFKLMVFSATFGICLVYLADIALQFFGYNVPFIHESGWLGIGFSAFVVIMASLNLVLDFDFIENGVQRGAAKHMEWYAGFGLLVTLVWLYLEILRLLSKIQRN